MKFLKNNGFTDEEIEEIVDKYDKDTIKELVFYQDLVEEVIEYFKEYGIEDIPRLMLERIDIFFVPLKKIKELFNLEQIATKDYTYLANSRQISLAKQAYKNLLDAEQAIEDDQPVDMIEIDLKECFDTKAECIITSSLTATEANLCGTAFDYLARFLIAKKILKLY